MGLVENNITRKNDLTYFRFGSEEFQRLMKVRETIPLFYVVLSEILAETYDVVTDDEVNANFGGILLRAKDFSCYLWVGNSQIEQQRLLMLRNRSFDLIFPTYTTADHKEKLLQLAAGLRGRLAAEFTMALFTSNAEEMDNRLIGCGSAGCALGHGVYLVQNKPTPMSWGLYCYLLYGITSETKAWEWCFSPNWRYTDDTPVGAAERIEYYLTHGAPDDAFWQMKGEVPLCYKGFVYQE